MQLKSRASAAVLFFASAAFGLAGCHDHDNSGSPAPTYTVGGKAQGLTGSGLVLQDNAGDNLTVAAPGTSFTFAKALASGATYDVTVLTQPSGPAQTCSVSGGGPTAIGNANVTSVVVNCVSKYSIGGQVQGLTGSGLVLQDNGGDNLSITAPGGAFSFASAVASGANYDVTVLTQPSSQTCAVTGGGPTAVAAANVTSVVVTCTDTAPSSGHFAYVANDGDSTISAYAINSTTGALTPLAGSPYAMAAAQVGAFELQIDPSRKFLYVVNDEIDGPGTVSGFAINAADGSLTPVTGSPFTTGNTPVSLAFDASGKYLYVANAVDNNISAFSVNAGSGQLTALANSPFTISGNNPNPFQIRCAGNYLYVSNVGTGTIDVLAIAGTGQLTEGVAGSPYLVPSSGGLNSGFAMVLNPSGTLLYVNGFNNGDYISAYAINSTTGVLTSVAASTLPVTNVDSIYIDPMGKFLFAAASFTNGVTVYPINAGTGLLGDPVAGSPFATGTSPFTVAVDATDHFVYVGNDASSNVSEFTLNSASGVLTPVTGSPVVAGQFPDNITLY